MKNKLLIAALLASLVAVVAYAQVNPRTLGDIFGYKAVVITKDTGVNDPRAGALHIGRLNREFPSTDHRITRLLRGSYTVNFSTSRTIVCEDSGNLTLTGARTGDLCLVTPPADGSGTNASFTCRVSATDTVIIRFCPHGTAVTPGSDTYALMVLSNASP